VSGMDPVAAGGFSTAAGHYARSRPGYARPAVGLLKESIPAGPVLDLAAGTGILTGQLRRAGRDVVAAEPLPEMLAHLRRALPEVPAVACVAEALALRDGSFAGVTVAQAFHWFDAPAAVAEVRRVLVPGGVLAMVFNVRDESVPWVRDLVDLVERASGGRPYPGGRGPGWGDVVADAGGFGAPAVHRFDNPVASSPEALVRRVRSTSFVAVMAEEARERLVAEVVGLVGRTEELAGRPAFADPHVTEVHLWAAGDGP